MSWSEPGRWQTRRPFAKLAGGRREVAKKVGLGLPDWHGIGMRSPGPDAWRRYGLEGVQSFGWLGSVILVGIVCVWLGGSIARWLIVVLLNRRVILVEPKVAMFRVAQTLC